MAQELEQIVQRMIDAGESEENIATVIQGYSAEAAPGLTSSGGPSAGILAARQAPTVLRAAGRAAANHPAAIQKAIGAGMSAATAGIGGALAGPPGAMAGALIRGVTPTQAGIRTMAGRLAGEGKDVAREAGRAVGIQEYIKSTSGLKVNPAHILERPQGLPAAEAYAKSQGRGILKILGPNGEVVAGPTAQAAKAATPKAASLVSRAAKGAGRFMPLLQAASGITDLAQTLEPNRRDIGWMGIGASTPDPSPEELEQVNRQNTEAMDARLAEQAAKRAALRDSIFSMLGLQ